MAVVGRDTTFTILEGAALAPYIEGEGWPVAAAVARV